MVDKKNIINNDDRFIYNDDSGLELVSKDKKETKNEDKKEEDEGFVKKNKMEEKKSGKKTK